MSSHLIATNGFMAFVWLIVTILIAVVVGPSLEPEDADPSDQASADAVVGAMVTAAILILVAYLGAAVGAGFDQPWGHGLTMMLLPVTLIMIPIGVWQAVVLIRHPA